MNICLFNAVCSGSIRSPDALVSCYRHVAELARALADRDHEVHVVQTFHESAELDFQGVRWIFVGPAQPKSYSSRLLEIEDFDAAARVFMRLELDVIHMFGLTLHGPLRDLTRWARNRSVQISASFHGGRPHRNVIRKWKQKLTFREVSALMFTAPEFEARWRASGVIAPHTAVTIAPELSSPFSGKSKRRARQQLGLSGSPLIAWTARLDPVKDPLTALEGFRRVLCRRPDARLLMAYYAGQLEHEVRRFLEANPPLREQTKLLGQIPHDQVETLFSAADFFVQSSIREVGGNSLVEAMSCGAIPVVTDIPSFRQLTSAVGPARLFACRDPQGMADAILGVPAAQLPTLAAEVRSAFEDNLSYPALAGIYERTFAAIGRLT